MHYNFVREHMTLATTPAVMGGIATRPWSLGELVTMALDAAEEAGEPTDPGDDDGTDGAGDGWGETVDPVTGEVQLTLPLWTQGTLPGIGMAAANDGESEEQAPRNAHG